MVWCGASNICGHGWRQHVFARPLRSADRRWPVAAGLFVGTFGFDAYAYWNVTMPDPYSIPVGALDSYRSRPRLAEWT